MPEAELEFGRLDFLLADGRECFLEVNPNGQWAWLDLDGKEGIFDAVVKTLTNNWGENTEQLDGRCQPNPSDNYTGGPL